MKGKLFIAVMAAAGAILAYQLFIPPVTGLADQGDFIRTIGRFGYGPMHHGSLEYAYVEPEYVPDPSYRAPYWEQANSEYVFVGAALLLNKLVSKDGALDITVMGLVHALAFLAVFARLLWVVRRHRVYPLLWIGALVALTDAGYAVYWNSFYAEPASCIFFLLLLAEAVEIGRVGEVSPAAMLRWSLWAILWVFAKPQNAPIGLVVGLFTLRLAFWTPSRRARLIAAAGACVLFGCAAYSVIAMPPVGRMANAYGMVFSGILPESRDAAADLRALGLDPQLAPYSGTGAWSPVTAFPALAESGALRKVSTFTILRFYLLRPARSWRRLHGVLPAITFLRPPYGNFEPSAGLPPKTLSRAFNTWSGFHEHVLPVFNKWIVFALAAWPLCAAWIWFRQPDGVPRKRIELLTLLPVCAMAALFGSVFGDAFDLTKHLFLFNLLLDTCLLYAAAMVWKTAAERPEVVARVSKLNTLLRRPVVSFLVILGALLIAYFPAIHGYYLHTDDYFVSGWSGFPHAAVIQSQVVVGRPLTGLAFCAYGLARTMNSMNVLRAISILNLAVLGFLVFGYLRRELSSATVALAACIALLTTPPFTTAVGYLATATFALAVTLASVAFLLASERVIPKRATSRWGYAGVALLLLIAGLSFYQPGALFYLALVAVSTFLCDPLTLWREHIRKLALHAGIVASACAIYYIAWRIWLHAAGAPLGGKYDGRRFVGDIWERLKWFVRTPLMEAANLWFVRPWAGYAILAGCVVLLALCLEISSAPTVRRVAGVFGKAAAVIAMLPMTYGISLASYMPSAEYRTYTALEGTIVLLFVLSLSHILSAVPQWIPPRWATGAVAAVALCGVCAANVTVRRYFTVPDSIEFRFVKDQIDRYRRTAGADFTNIDVIVRPDPVAPVQRNEMGEPSLRHGPNLRPMVTAALRELGIARDVPVFQSLPSDPSTWVLWGTELHWISLDNTYGPPRAGKTITIDATKIKKEPTARSAADPAVPPT